MERGQTVVALAIATKLLAAIPSGAGEITDPKASSEAAIQHLAESMDAFHTRFPVYDDVSSAGNHFHAFAKIPDETAPVNVNGSWTNNPHSGATAIRNEFRPEAGFGGFYFLNGYLPSGEQAPLLNFGTIPDAGIDLSGATRLRFWVRGENGDERVEFFVAGVGRDKDTGERLPDIPYPDSTPRAPPRGTVTVLTRDWREVTIDLGGKDLSYVLGGFGWVASAAANPQGAVFYVDDIQYDLDEEARARRLSKPRLVRSFTTQPFQVLPPPVGDFDLVLRNAGFLYDNALAILAFLAEGSSDALRRARLVGDALVYAEQHDRRFDGGRLRDAYAAGDIELPPGWTPNGRAGTVPVPGFYNEPTQQFIEIEQAGLSTGNQAWAMIALLALHRRTNEPSYLETASRLGTFIRTLYVDGGTYPGFRGGLNDPDGQAQIRPWASTEHNLDIVAGFSVLADVTGDETWRADAERARQFVESMWDAERGCYLTGTIDPDTRNATLGQLPVDAQPWVALSIPGATEQHPDLLGCAERLHATADLGFSGFDFNDDRDGVWFEGTAQMAVARAFGGDAPLAASIASELRRAQQTAPFGDGRGIAAASHDGVSTGFDTSGNTPFRLFRRLHVGATAWLVFAQRQFNPFYATTTGPCEDNDACTLDVPYATGGCTHPLVVAPEGALVTCHLDNLEPLLAAPTPACRPKCLRKLSRQLLKIQALVQKASSKPRSRCLKVLSRGVRIARTVDKKVSQLVRRQRFGPAERQQRVQAETTQLVRTLMEAGEKLCGG